MIDNDEFEALGEEAKQACRTSSSPAIPVIEPRSVPTQRQSTIQEVKAWNANRKLKKAEALRKSQLVKEAIEFAKKNPLTVGSCTYSADRKSTEALIIAIFFRRETPDEQKATVNRLRKLKESGYTDKDCVRPGTEIIDPKCAAVREEVAKNVKHAERCAAWDCLDLDGEDPRGRTDPENIRRALELVYGSPPTNCAVQLPYPERAFLVASAGAKLFRQRPDRARLASQAKPGVAVRDPHHPPQRDPSAGAAGLMAGVATGAATAAVSAGGCVIS